MYLQRGALKGARIGVVERYFTPAYGASLDRIAVVQEGIAAMTS